MKASAFPKHLSELRAAAQLTVRALAERAGVPHSLIAGLQTGNRRVGENNARRIGLALGLQGRDLEQFIYCAIDTCTEKVLEDAKPYPSEILNLLPMQLKTAGIEAQALEQFTIAASGAARTITLAFDGDKHATIETRVSAQPESIDNEETH